MPGGVNHTGDKGAWDRSFDASDLASLWQASFCDTTAKEFALAFAEFDRANYFYFTLSV